MVFFVYMPVTPGSHNLESEGATPSLPTVREGGGRPEATALARETSPSPQCINHSPYPPVSLVCDLCMALLLSHISPSPSQPTHFSRPVGFRAEESAGHHCKQPPTTCRSTGMRSRLTFTDILPLKHRAHSLIAGGLVGLQDFTHCRLLGGGILRE